MARRGKPAGPPGRKTLARAREQLAAGWPAGLTVLTGDDLYHLDRAQRELIGALVPQEATDFALTIFSEGKVEVGKVVSAARSVGMFAPTRVVLVRDVGVLDGEPDPLEDFAGRPPGNAYLIVRAPQLDKRRKLHQALAKRGTLLAFGRIEDSRVEVAALAKEKKVSLGRPAIEFLAAVCGGDLYRVESELEKLAVATGEKRGAAVDLETVRESAAGSGLLSGWEAADALLTRDPAAALGALRRLADSGEDPLKLIGGLAYRARAMLKAKAMVEAGRAPRSAAPAAGLWGVPPQAIERGLKAYRMEEMLAFPATLLAADRDLKSRRIAGSAVLENALDRLISGETE